MIFNLFIRFFSLSTCNIIRWIYASIISKLFRNSQIKFYIDVVALTIWTGIFVVILSLSSQDRQAPSHPPNSRQLPFNSSCRAVALHTRVHFCSLPSVLWKEEVLACEGLNAWIELYTFCRSCYVTTNAMYSFHFQNKAKPHNIVRGIIIIWDKGAL